MSKRPEWKLGTPVAVTIHPDGTRTEQPITEIPQAEFSERWRRAERAAMRAAGYEWNPANEKRTEAN